MLFKCKLGFTFLFDYLSAKISFDFLKLDFHIKIIQDFSTAVPTQQHAFEVFVGLQHLFAGGQASCFDLIFLNLIL